MAQETSNEFKEYLLSINEFMTPKILKKDQAAYTDIIRLFLLDPGTNQTHPDMGIGIRSRYRFSDTSEIFKLQQEAKDQMKTYLPSLLTMDIQIETYGTTLAIFITSENDEVYALGYNTETGSIGGLTIDDIR